LLVALCRYGLKETAAQRPAELLDDAPPGVTLSLIPNS
jgi:hypothetical protein